MQLAEPESLDIVETAALAEALARPGAIGPTTGRLVAALHNGDLICVTLDEPRAAALAAALRAAVPGTCVVHLPAPDALPGDPMPSSPRNIGMRHLALHQIAAAQGQRRAMILSVEAALTLTPPVMMVEKPLLQFHAGASTTLELLAGQIDALGYQPDDRIDEPGEVAVRGAIELFPTTALSPVRLDIAEGRLMTIRSFDPVSQRSTDTLDHVALAPASWPSPSPAWIGALDHMPDAAVALDPGVEQRHGQLRELAGDIPSNGPSSIVSDDAWKARVAATPAIEIAPGDEIAGERFAEKRRPDRAASAAIQRHLAAGDRVILAGTARDLRFLSRRLQQSEAPPLVGADCWAAAMSAPPGTIATLILPIDAGWRASGLVVIAAADILGSRADAVSDGGHRASADLLGGSVDYRIGDVVIHEDHGLGRLKGVEPVPLGEGRSDAIRVEYAKGAQRLVPVADAGRIWRYGADADAIALDRLDGASWVKRRGDIDAAIATTAKALIDFAAEREARRTSPIVAPASAYERFVGRFPFTATRDQLRAIEAVRADLASGRPMDRLVVGDVGYGKTEVALRAAAMTALSGRQVAVIAPTTVLARQHLDSFARRFAGLGITVAGLSRLSSAAERKAVKAGLADGSIAVVVGTQAVAAKDVTFVDLALVIIDEEQRFGAADKAKLRSRTAEIHVLTLTATPIPRTLQSVMVGIQDLSVIATPPARRQPIRTITGPFEADTLRAALLREKSRGGQSFVVVPRIEDIAPVADQLARLVPGLSLREAHGKMDASVADTAMIDFAQGRSDILLATNIIEAGLDVPRANLMAVLHADRFGLAQLHQLRGRVGRSARRGTILLLTEAGKTLAPATAKRLKTLEALDHLGAGFAISAQDLDQRGAGDLVGEEQAGHVRLIGIDLYQHLLHAALAVARGGSVDRWRPEVNLGGDIGFPSDWIGEEDIRINLYLRLARLADETAIDDFAEELEDRFGALPEPARRQIALAHIRLLALAARVARIDAGPRAVALTPRPDFTGETSGLEKKDGRFLLRGDFGSDLPAAVSALLERMVLDR